MQTALSQRAMRSAFKPTVARNGRVVKMHVATEEAPSASEIKARKVSPLERGGTLSGVEAAGKDAGAAAKAALAGDAPAGEVMQIVDGRFVDYRWANGRWDFTKFPKTADGETNWDLVIDAEIARRALLEDTPIPSTNEDPVLFDTSEIPMMAWIKRFHLPEAEKLNGRAAMMGYLIAALVELAGGPGLVEQQESFLGKLMLHVFVFGILAVRSMKDLDNFQNLADEATFYDSQWQATWEGVERPSESAKQ